MDSSSPQRCKARRGLCLSYNLVSCCAQDMVAGRPLETVTARIRPGVQVEEGGCLDAVVRLDVLIDQSARIHVGTPSPPAYVLCNLSQIPSTSIRLKSAQVTCISVVVSLDQITPSRSTLSLQGVTKCQLHLLFFQREVYT